MEKKIFQTTNQFFMTHVSNKYQAMKMVHNLTEQSPWKAGDSQLPKTLRAAGPWPLI